MPDMARDIARPDELIGSRVIINGASGAGKSYVVRRLLEETHGRMQHIVLDVEDEFFTLRERFDYVLIGGEGADAPVTEDSAGQLARTLLELGVSAILQLNDLGLAGQRRLIGAFLSGLMAVPKSLWHPVLVVLDEAHRAAPQSGPVASSEPLINLATAGRKRGFGAVFATQRLSQLSKDILGQCPNRIMGRVDQALDRRAAAEVLGFSPSSAEAQGLMRLHREFWVVGPAFAATPELVKFSPALTTHIHAGHRNVPSPPTPERVRAMLGKLAAAATNTHEYAPEGAPDARKPPSHATKVAPDATALAAARAAGIEEGKRLAGADFESGLREGHRRGLRDAATAVEGALGVLAQGTDLPVAPVLPEGEAIAQPEAVMPLRRLSSGRQAGRKRDQAMQSDAEPEEASDKLPKGHQRILDALAWFEAARIPAPGRNQVAWAASYRADTGHFGNMLTDLWQWGLIVRKSSSLALTDAGRQHAQRPAGKLTAAILVERIKAKIGGPTSKVLDELVRVYPSAAKREDLAAATGYRADTGHFGNIITELTVPEIATRPERGEVRLADWVMLKG